MAQEAFGVGAAEFDDAVGDGFEECAVVADDEGGEGWVCEDFFEPEDAVDVEVIGGFVHEEEIGIGGESGDDGEAFSPAAGEFFGCEIWVGEFCAIEGLGGAEVALVVIEMGIGCRGYAIQAGLVWGEGVFLGDVAGAELAAGGECAVVGLFLAG